MVGVVVVLSLVFPWGKHLQSDLFCVEWDVKAQLSPSMSELVAMTSV